MYGEIFCRPEAMYEFMVNVMVITVISPGSCYGHACWGHMTLRPLHFGSGFVSR